MRTLIIQLPPGPVSPATVYPHAVVQPEQAETAVRLQWSSATLLPAADRQTEVIALLPAASVSWHRVELPPGLHKQASRLQAALQGLLEDRLLDEPGQLHMALQTDWKDSARPWVAVCDRAWLHSHVQALEQAGLPVHRIVPELSPDTPAPTVATDADDAQPLRITALGDANTGWLWVSHPERGVWGQPIQSVRPGSTVLGLSATETTHAQLQAEPAVVALSSDALGRPARLMPPGQHWMAAIATGWDLAQFDLRANAQTRHLKNWQRGLSTLWRSPAWRPARWGLGMLLVSQLVGIQAWAWKTRADWQAEQQSWTHILRESFPQTQVVVDAPLQMAREVDRLRQSSGQLNPADLEAMLSALGQSLPVSAAAPRQWTYQTGQLRLQDFKPNTNEQVAVQNDLQAHGYRFIAEGDGWLISPVPRKEGTP